MRYANYIRECDNEQRPTRAHIHIAFPYPASDECQGWFSNNWEFFKQQWQDYEVATGPDKQEQKIRLATFRSAMGKDCLKIFVNLKLSSEQRQDIHECIEALEAHFKPKRNLVYERYFFNMWQQNPDEPVDGYVNRLRKAASTRVSSAR